MAAAGRVTLALVRELEGDAIAALAALETLDQIPEATNIQLVAGATRSLATCDLGDAIAAERMARASLDWAEGLGLGASRAGGSVWLALGNALTAQGRFRDALPCLDRALGSWGVPGTLHRAHVLLVLASAHGGSGETAKARAAAREAADILAVCPHAGSLPARLLVVERTLRMKVARAIPVGDRPSDAEMRVLRLLATPLSTREIAGQLYLSPNTVKTHVKSLHHKLDAATRDTTVARARELGLI
jgi:ATP/maltotriose-dependent transcriptional regulator MalT